MASRFEVREVGTGRVLGVLELEQDLGPGEALRQFVDGQVQLEHQAVAAPPAEPPAEPPAPPKGRRSAAK